MAVGEDRRRIGVRLAILQIAAIVAFAALAMSFWYLQVVQHAYFKEITMKNGRPATEGVCPDCGTKIFKIGKAS